PSIYFGQLPLICRSSFRTEATRYLGTACYCDHWYCWPRPISPRPSGISIRWHSRRAYYWRSRIASHYPGCRSEEHTSELQSRFDLVCRLLLEKKNKNN